MNRGYQNYKIVHVSQDRVEVLRLFTGWTVQRRDPGGGEIFRTYPGRTWKPPSLPYDGYRVFLGVKTVGKWRWQPTI